MSGPADRVAGWDLLRGLCALAVMAYHLLGWTDLAHLSAFGTYGVYLFFTLSGASLGFAYPAASVASPRAVATFLATRWFRLGPLYVLACLVFLAMLAAHLGAWADRLPLRLALNASFAFGLWDPAVWALAVGGWSLGIEFVFYLLFPALAWAAGAPRGRWGVLALCVGVQAAWVASTVGRHGLEQAGVAYHQVPAFLAYFFTGCLIGQDRRGRSGHAGWPIGAAIGAWVTLGALLALASGPVAGGELAGAWGVALPAACVAAVWASGRTRVQGRAAVLAASLGDLTYGTYLLHPLVFFGLAWFAWPGVEEASSTATRIAFAAGVAVSTLTCAALGFRWIETPARQLGRQLLRRPRAQSDAASIAS